MKRIKLLMPLTGVAAVSAAAFPLTACGGDKDAITPTLNVTGGTATYTTIKLNTSFTITFTPNTDYVLSSVTITIGDNTLKQTTDYTISGNTITVKASAVTSKTIVITIKATKTETTSKVITSDTTLTSGDFKSTTSDSNAVLVNGNGITANLSNLTLNKTGDCSNTEDSSFYGTNSALLAKGGSTTILDNINVTTDAKGANGVFAYGGASSTKESAVGDGTNITISNSTINTTQSNSGGVMVAGHASLTANDCTVITQGSSSAAIRSDRGGEKMTIKGGNYTSNGTGSPAIYATATINVEDATLKSTTSEGVIIEGKNDVTLKNCKLEDKNWKHNSSKSSEYKNIFLYQSNSGDATVGNDSFTAEGCTITTHQGDDFYVTNQTSVITLTNNTFINDWTPTAEIPQKAYFLRCKVDGWSTKYGGYATLNLNNQTLTNRDIDIDSISTLKLNMHNGSKWSGTLTNANQSTTGVVVTIDEGCNWTLTGNSYIGSIDSGSLERVTTSEGCHLFAWNESTSNWDQIK